MEEDGCERQISFFCKMLGVSREGYYEYLTNRNKPYKYAALSAKMWDVLDEDIYNDTYGYVRMREALLFKASQTTDFPHVPSKRTVYRIMEHENLLHKKKRKPHGITKEDREAQKSDNLLKRDFTAERPCEKTVTDITEMQCSDGKLYGSAMFDCFDTVCLAIELDDNMRKELAMNTLESACLQYPELSENAAISHSDRGSQYTSGNDSKDPQKRVEPGYRDVVAKHGIRQSMNSAAGRCHDNAKCESMWARFKEECLYGRYDTTKMTMSEVKTLVWRYFMSYWNNRRICSAIGGIPPMEKRRRFYENASRSEKTKT